jgi:hypothetical protein
VTRQFFRLAALLALAALPVAAQEVQRCEGADGKVSDANGSCPPGTAAARTLPPAGAPSTSEQKAAQQRARQDVRDAAELDRERKAEQARLARGEEQAQAKANKQEAQCRRLQTRLKQEQPELAEATQNRRAEELYVADCAPVRN